MVRRTQILRSFRQSICGAALIETTFVIVLLFVVIFGLVDFGYAFYQWNAASKAVQVGTRLLAVSSPISSDLATFSGCGGGSVVGGASIDYERRCDGATGICTGGNFDAVSFSRLIFGVDGLCSVPPVGRAGMCDIFRRIQPQNVVVTYEYSGLGYCARPGGPVPTIRIELQNLPFNFVALDGLLGLNAINIPPMTSSITGEDLATTWTK